MQTENSITSRGKFKEALLSVWSDYELYRVVYAAKETKLSFRNFLRKNYAKDNEQEWFNNLLQAKRIDNDYSHELSEAIEYLNFTKFFFKK